MPWQKKDNARKVTELVVRGLILLCFAPPLAQISNALLSYFLFLVYFLHRCHFAFLMLAEHLTQRAGRFLAGHAVDVYSLIFMVVAHHHLLKENTVDKLVTMTENRTTRSQNTRQRSLVHSNPGWQC